LKKTPFHKNARKLPERAYGRPYPLHI